MIIDFKRNDSIMFKNFFTYHISYFIASFFAGLLTVLMYSVSVRAADENNQIDQVVSFFETDVGQIIVIVLAVAFIGWILGGLFRWISLLLVILSAVGYDTLFTPEVATNIGVAGFECLILDSIMRWIGISRAGGSNPVKYLLLGFIRFARGLSTFETAEQRYTRLHPYNRDRYNSNGDPSPHGEFDENGNRLW